MQDAFSTKIHISPAVILLSSWAGTETQPLTPEPGPSHRPHCMTTGHHLPHAEPGVKQASHRRDAGTSEEIHYLAKACVFFLDLGLSSFAAFPLSLDVRFHRALHGSTEHLQFFTGTHLQELQMFLALGAEASHAGAVGGAGEAPCCTSLNSCFGRCATASERKAPSPRNSCATRQVLTPC